MHISACAVPPLAVLVFVMLAGRTGRSAGDVCRILVIIVAIQAIQGAQPRRELLQSEGSRVEAKAVAATSTGGLALVRLTSAADLLVR